MENRSNQPAGRRRRQRVMRNRAILVIAVAALVCALGAAGAVAFLIDNTKPVENKFEYAQVTCAVDESFDKTTGEKSNVRIQNTSNIDAYIRVALVTYYVDANGDVDGTKASPDLSFTVPSDWFVKDGYYYYTKPVASNGYTPNLIESITLADGQVVEVIASAIQSKPAAAVTEAWGVTVNADGTLSAN